MTLRAKLFVLVAAVTIFSTTGVTAVALWREVLRGQELLAREGAALAASVGPVAARWLGADGPLLGAEDALGSVVERLIESAPLDRAWVVDRRGRVVACVDHSGKGCPPGVPSEFGPAQGPLDALHRLVSPAGLLTGAPVLRQGEIVGAVRVDYCPEEVVGGARRLGLGAGFIALLFLVWGQVFAAIFIRRLTRPLTRVALAAEALAREESGVAIEVPDEKELSELVHAFNGMSERLAARRQENERLIASLEQRVEEKTRDVLRADRLATLGGIAAGFAHELGNSINVVRGYNAVILRELPPDHPNRPDLEAVRRETGRCSGMLERFLVFARARKGTPQPCSLEPVLREAVEVVGPIAADGRVESALEIEPGLPLVRADAELLRQAFVNLCVNAVQAMQPRGGKLTVRARAQLGSLVLEFEDTGPGIPPEARAHIFEPFYTTKANGTGLGLAIVRQAAEAHGGRVEVESEPGKGALFRMRLPAVAPGEERAA